MRVFGGTKLVSTGTRLVGTGTRLVGTGTRLVGTGTRLVGTSTRFVGTSIYGKKEWFNDPILMAVGFGLVLVGAAIGALWAVRSYDPLGDSASDAMQTWEVFYSLFGLMYAIMVGLLIVEAHKRLSDLSSTIQREISTVAIIDDYLSFLNDTDETLEARRELCDALKGYVKKFEEDWDWVKKTNRGRESLFVRLNKFSNRNLTPIVRSAKNLKSKDRGDDDAIGEIMKRISDLTMYRADWIGLAEEGLSWTLFIVVGFMSLCLMGGILLLDVTEFWFHGLILSVIVVALYSLFMLLIDMDRPFHGSWKVKVGEASLEDVKERLNARFGDASDS